MRNLYAEVWVLVMPGFSLDVDPSFVEPKFMLEYEMTFGDERAEDSADD
jgi:hypothetical protein